MNVGLRMRLFNICLVRFTKYKVYVVVRGLVIPGIYTILVNKSSNVEVEEEKEEESCNWAL